MAFSVLEKAKNALSHYSFLMTGTEAGVTITVCPERFSVKDAELDDAYTVHVSGGKGEITASNERSALIAVYHLLRENGCMFVRPGASSERVPRIDIAAFSAELSVNAAHRFRGLCIEGSCNLDDLLDQIEWMPKVGYNCYFMQFREGYNFFQRWYEGEANSVRKKSDFNMEICRDILPRVLRAIRENGLLLHAVGHGFTCECFGVPGLGWDGEDDSIWPKDAVWALAMRNGVRNMEQHIPLMSALCYSNPDVRKAVVDGAVAYIEEHPEIDYLHFWMDDGSNNKCECPDCASHLLSEDYIELLNLLDEELTKRGLRTRIVFLAYIELMWPPVKTLLNDSDRFIFMFAPILRNFREPLGIADEETAGMKPYRLNRQTFPASCQEYRAHLKAWNAYRKRTGMPDENGFEFDYFCRDYDEPGQFRQAEAMYADVLNMKRNALNGIMNCQPQRSFYQAGMTMYMMPRVLMQPELSFEQLADEFFTAAYGVNGPAMKEWCRKLSHTDEETMEEMLSAEAPCEEAKDLCTAHTLQLYRFAAEMNLEILKLKRMLRAGDKEKAAEQHDAILRIASEREAEFSRELDCFHLRRRLGNLMDAGKDA